MKKLEALLRILREEVVLWRREYLKKIDSFRRDGRKIYYLDETWINGGPTENIIKPWENSARKSLLSRKKRLIVCHIGSKEGFVPEAMWVFVSRQSNHEEMNSKSFEAWFLKILPLLKKNSVIVMDNASYHSRRLEKVPISTTKKEEIENWLAAKNIEFNKNSLKSDLLSLVKLHKNEHKSYVVDEMAKNYDKTVVRLPPYHCELNPMELIWVQIKNYVTANNSNSSSKLNDMRELFVEAVNSVNSNNWKNCVKHVEEKVEKKMWKLDDVIQHKFKSIIINR